MLSIIVPCLTIYDLCHAYVTIDCMLVPCLTIIDICHAYCELHFSVNAFFFFCSVKRHDACQSLTALFYFSVKRHAASVNVVRKCE